MLPLTRPATEAEIPIIDLKNLAFADAGDKAAMVNQIRDVCRNAGFFYIVNHGVEPEAVGDMFTAATQFFGLPLAAKNEVSIKNSGWNFHGYLPPFHKGVDPKLKENLQEAFQVHLELPPDDPDAKTPLYGPNPWPSAMPDLRPRMEGYREKMIALGDHMLKLFALALGLPEDGLAPYVTKPTSMLRLLHYPPQKPDDSPEHLGTRAHTDTGIFTMLAQDDTGGLEIMLKTGEWVLATPVKDSFIVNLGEVMHRWSDGLFAATPHRVINRYGAERYSIPYFVMPNYHASFEPKIRNTEERDEKFDVLISNKAHSCYGDWIMEVYSRIYYKPDDRAA